MKRPRKVALISVFDYPRNDYRAYWLIDTPQGSDLEGWRWAAHLHSYEPLAWDFNGKRTVERPPVAAPTVTPEAARDVDSYRLLVTRMLRDARAAAKAGGVYSLYAPDVPVKESEFAKLDKTAQAVVRQLQDARRELAAIVYDMHPIPIHLIEEAVGVADTKDAADTAAQQWVLARIEQHRRDAPLAKLDDSGIAALIAEFDAARARRDFGVVDSIRGTLKSAGVQITEPAPIDVPGTTAWTRKQRGYAQTLGLAGLVFDAALGLWRRVCDIVLMALAYSTTLRNNRMNQVRDAIDGGAGAGLWRIYDGSRPATCGTATTLLAELTCSDPCAAGASGGVMTFSAITSDASANATGTATWSRNVDSTGTCCIDGNVGTSGSDLNLNSTSISSGQQVSITSATITEGNA